MTSSSRSVALLTLFCLTCQLLPALLGSSATAISDSTETGAFRKTAGDTPSNSMHLSTECPSDPSAWSQLFLDILFVVDTSAGVSQNGLNILKATLYAAITQFTVGQSNSQTRVGLLRFGDKTELVYNFTVFETTDDAVIGLKNFLEDESNFNSVTANIDEGIYEAVDYIRRAGRPGFGQVIVVLSSKTVNCSDVSDQNALACQYAAVFMNGPHREIFSISIGSPGQHQPTVVDLGNSPCIIFNGSDPNLQSQLLTQLSYANCFCKDGQYVQVRSVNATDCRRYAECVWAGNTATREDIAESVCDDTLVIVHDQDKQYFLNYFDDPSGILSSYPYWIGLKGVYPNLQWQDGTPLSDGDYTNWAIQPTPGQRICVWMQLSGLNNVPKWYPQNCSQTAHFICQEPACSPGNVAYC